MSMARLAGVLALVVMGTAGCGSATPSSATNPSSHKPWPHATVGVVCPSDWEGKGKQVWFNDSKGVSLGGIELGSGTTGIVLAHQADTSTCIWLPYGNELADTGYRVIAFDFAGNGVSEPPTDDDSMDDNVLAAAAFLRHEGATKVVLMGASMGAAASIVAGTHASPQVAGVISLSSPTTYNEENALGAADLLTVPVLYVAGSDDPGFASAAHSLYDATPGASKTLLIADSDEHGVALLSQYAPDAAKVRAAVTKFLTANAKP